MAPGQPSPAADALQSFSLPAANARGAVVRLEDAWDEVAGRSEHPAAVTELLGEALAAAALLTAHAKIDGRLSLQLRGPGPVRMLFAECTAEGTVRGIAQVDEETTGAGLTRDVRELGEGAVLAITIENHAGPGREPRRYQGLVPLESESLQGALEDYFRQSEQLPTRILLAADGHRVAGLLLQRVPGEGGHGATGDDADGWLRATALMDTLGQRELLDVPSLELLHRLFHEEEVRVPPARPLRFACSCSRARVADVLSSLGEEEALAAAVEGVAEIRCEFCGERYHFDADAIAGLFRNDPSAPAPDRLQ
jgi:molecular chaperone Hsp33